MSPYISHISPVHLAGELLVFNTKTRVRKEGKTVTVCRYVQTLSGHQPYPLGLATLKGFLFSASPELLTGYPEPEPEPEPLARAPHRLPRTRTRTLTPGPSSSQVSPNPNPNPNP